MEVIPKTIIYLLTIKDNKEDIIETFINNVENFVELPKNIEWNDKIIINCNIEYFIDKNTIIIMLKLEHLTKPKLNEELIKKELNIDNINIKILRRQYNNIDEYINKNMNKYESQKNAIYKWREANKETYLLKQHQYFKNKMENPEHKRANLERIKERNKKLKEEEQQRTGIIRKVGRPSKY
jgi:hypothetical protein